MDSNNLNNNNEINNNLENNSDYQNGYTEETTNTENSYTYDQSAVATPENNVGKVLSIVSICCGVTSTICCWVPLVYILGFITGPAGVITGIIALNKKGIKGLAIAGIVTGGLGVVLCIVNLIFGFAIGTFGLL